MRQNNLPNVNAAHIKQKQRNGLSSRIKKESSCLSNTVQFTFFLVWLICTGIGGFFVGHAPVTQDCPPPPDPVIIQQKQDCVHESLGAGMAIGAIEKKDGFTYDELTRLWTCSHAQANFTQANKKIFPKEKNLDKTKWKSILSVEPKAFFSKYLSQYPADTRAVQPVVVFSHKPLDDFKDISDVCKVIDIAIVPDTPGVCVAVTETYHDVASYHMLHADRQPDGTFALTANSLEGRTLPSQEVYASSRALLLEYFNNVDYVAKQVKGCPRFNQNRVAIGVLLENMEEVSLFKNSVESAYKHGISKTKFCVFTTSSEVDSSMGGMGLKVVHLSSLKSVGTLGDANVGVEFRRYFLQAWLSFAVANEQIKMMWQSPATIWFERPDNIMKSVPVVETLWVYKGRNDKRAAPFFPSFDFFVPSGNERPVHLLHEILLHFDLVLAWKSLDAVTAYRLSENNARLVCVIYIFIIYSFLKIYFLKQ
jgi:hypothetical protein